MKYSDVVKNGLILPKKEKYTRKDFDTLVSYGVSRKMARFICICSATYHDTQYSGFFNHLEV